MWADIRGVILAGIWLPALVAASFPAMAKETYVQSIKPFDRATARFCPASHLENIDPGNLNLIIDAYLESLTPEAEKRMARAAQPMCVESVAGVSCANIAYIRAARRLGRTSDLAKAACHSGYVCRASFDCVKTN